MNDREINQCGGSTSILKLWVMIIWTHHPVASSYAANSQQQAMFTFQLGIPEYDIALMKIKGRIPYIWKRSVPALLPMSKHSRRWPLERMQCTIVGWGCTSVGGETVETASVAELTVVPAHNCSGTYEDVNETHEFCAGYYNSGVGICPVNEIL
ncbi:uncharacterized protein DEA37_0007460 [Paragonimus westermani]|uniref:Peptidase S1 domain-containing protein n=1 Tax=Paragonimus westermani TaxID=34504 RepID=A0A5J4NVX2_9TREM|nr:uncharacterized protein DEA37_0007460 [Paragonimus westermani]